VHLCLKGNNVFLNVGVLSFDALYEFIFFILMIWKKWLHLVFLGASKDPVVLSVVA
jgi:hypothetical protein